MFGCASEIRKNVSFSFPVGIFFFFDPAFYRKTNINGRKTVVDTTDTVFIRKIFVRGFRGAGGDFPNFLEFRTVRTIYSSHFSDVSTNLQPDRYIFNGTDRSRG